MSALFCFIDDSEFELENFQANAVKAYDRAEFVFATSFGEAAEQIGKRIPVCFLLDIFGGDPEAKPRLPKPAETVKMMGKPPSVERLYSNVEKPSPKEANLLLRRIYAYVNRIQMAFSRAAGMLGQGRHYGLENLAKVRENYPWATAIGYSRKALYADAVAMSMAGADGVLQKPQGDDDDAIAMATRQMSLALARSAYEMIDRRLIATAAPLALSMFDDPGSNSQLMGRALRVAVAAMGGASEGIRYQAGRSLEEVLDAGVSPSLTATVALAIAQWLTAKRPA